MKRDQRERAGGEPPLLFTGLLSTFWVKLWVIVFPLNLSVPHRSQTDGNNAS